MKNRFLKDVCSCVVCIVALFHFNNCTYQKKSSINPEIECSQLIPDTVSFKNDVLPLLGNNCSLAGCHSGPLPSGGLNLEPARAYIQLSRKGSGYIDTINPTRSVLYSSLVSKTNPMPPTGNLSDCDIELIATWMQQKAKNN